MRKPYLLVAALAALALFFGWRARQALDEPVAAGDNAARAASAGWQPGALAPDPPSPPDTATAVASIRNRPLFRADRRPYTEAGAGASARNFESELSRLSLIGIMAIGDDMKGIVVSKGSANTERWEVKVGDDLPGFKVKAIRTEGLTVTAEGREFLLPLYAGSPTAAGGGPVRTEVTRKEPAPAQPKPAAAPTPTAPIAPPQRPVPQPAVAPPTAPAQPAPVQQTPGYPRFTPRRR
jgi:hypothetical protein